MNSFFSHTSLSMNKPDNLSFSQWCHDFHIKQRKQDRLLWGSSLIGSSVFFIGLIWLGFHVSKKSLPVPIVDVPAAITLDLSTDIAPPPPPAITAQPNIQPLDEVPPPLDAPTAPSPNIVVPKTLKFEKIKPINPKKNPVKHSIPVQQHKSVLNTHHTPSTMEPAIPNNTTTSNTHSSSTTTSSHTTSAVQQSISPATWQSSVLRKLERLKQYPTDAQSDRQEGTVTIKITINRDGHVLSAKLVKSSGYSLLDKEAVALSYRANPLPVVPQSIKGNNITITVPVEFDMNK